MVFGIRYWAWALVNAIGVAGNTAAYGRDHLASNLVGVLVNTFALAFFAFKWGREG